LAVAVVGIDAEAWRLGGIEEIVEGTEEHEEPWNVDGERLEMELGGLEAWRLGGLEAWRLGGLETLKNRVDDWSGRKMH
jgi:hypothetical protein